MIFVMLGTQDKQFKRMIRMVDYACEKGIIKEEVIIQAGITKQKVKSDLIKMFSFISQTELDEYLDKARIVICHAGVGSILNALKKNKTTIVMARLKKFREHVNDHQLDILENFSKQGYIIKLEDETRLDKALKKAETFVPKKYKSNTENFNNKLLEIVNNL